MKTYTNIEARFGDAVTVTMDDFISLSNLYPEIRGEYFGENSDGNITYDFGYGNVVVGIQRHSER